MPEDRDEWQRRRREAADEHVEVLARRRAAESAQAREQLDAFVREALARGLPATALRVRAHSGRTTYRTDLVGWYLKRNGSLGVDTDGRYYVLSAPTSLRARLRGARVEPADPPLVVGVGGRDGESMPLQQLLDLRLAAGEDWT